MEWREDVGPARAGDAGARERLREYLTPFAHGVALASSPHHVAERLVPRILDEALRTLGGVEDASVGVHVMHVARRMAREATPGPISEQNTSNPALLEARQSISRLRSIPEQAREHFFLRLVEGIPGPELSQVARVPPGELRAELERAAAEAARAFGHGQSFAGDGYLWELVGEPPPLLARLEMQLPLLRFDPSAAPMVDATSHGTFNELKAVGGAPAKPALFAEFEGTETGVVTAPAPSRPSALQQNHNPFEKAVRTIAATDLPAEARGQLPSVPWVDPSKSGKQPALPPRPIPSVQVEGERSGKSSSGKSLSGKSGKQAQVNTEGSKSGRQPPMPQRLEVTRDGPRLDQPGEPDEPDELDDDATEARVPSKVLAAQAEIVTAPESHILGKPTMMLPLSEAIADYPSVLTSQTRIGGITVPTPQPGALDAPFFTGSQPIFVAVGLAVVGLVIYSTSLYAVDRQQRANWTLTQVVVAAEELGVGDVVTLENVALRAVPEPFQGSGVVRGEMMNFILDQKLAVGVQMGDPLFMSQFASMRIADQRLSKKVMKRTRGFTIATNAVASVGRWVKPGDLVDVLVTFPGKDGPRKQAERRAVTLLQKVPVLATGKIADEIQEATMDEREKAYVDVTLLLSPEEAEALTLGATLGRVKLTLRNGEDMEDDRNLDNAYTDSDTLLDGARQNVVSKKRQKIIQIIRAGPAPGR